MKNVNCSLPNELLEPEIVKLSVLNQHYIMPFKATISSQLVGFIHYQHSLFNTSNV